MFLSARCFSVLAGCSSRVSSRHRSAPFSTFPGNDVTINAVPFFGNCVAFIGTTISWQDDATRCHLYRCRRLASSTIVFSPQLLFFRFRPTTNSRFLLLFLRSFPFVSFPFVPLRHFSIFHRSLPLPFFLALPSYFLLRRFGNTRPIFYPFLTAFPFLYPPPRLLPFDTLLYSSIGRPNDRPCGWLTRPPSRIVRPIRSIISPRCSRKYCLLSFVFYFDPEIGAATLKRAYGLAFSLLCPGQLRPEWKRAKVLQSAMN